MKYGILFLMMGGLLAYYGLFLGGWGWLLVYGERSPVSCRRTFGRWRT